MLWVSLGFISCQMSTNITMNTKISSGGFVEGGDKLCAACWSPEAGSYPGEQHLPPRPPTFPGRAVLPARPGPGLKLVTPLLPSLSTLLLFLIQYLSPIQGLLPRQISPPSAVHKKPFTSDFLWRKHKTLHIRAWESILSSTVH